MSRFFIAIITIILMFTTNIFAADKKVDSPKETAPSNTVTLKEPAEFQKVIDEYKEYVAKVPASVRDEVIAYRKEIAKINKDKRLMYKQLSQESQDYLKKEQEYKKRLPVDKKALINSEAPGEKDKK